MATVGRVVIAAPFAGPLATLLRLLFPSWAFFDVATTPPTLEVRQVRGDGTTSAWQSAFTAPTRRAWHLVFNPAGTQVLLYQTQVERFALGIATNEHTCATHQTTSAIVRAIAEHAVASSWPKDEPWRWQFRVVVTDGSGVARLSTTVFESAVFA